MIPTRNEYCGLSATFGELGDAAYRLAATLNTDGFNQATRNRMRLFYDAMENVCKMMNAAAQWDDVPAPSFADVEAPRELPPLPPPELPRRMGASPNARVPKPGSVQYVPTPTGDFDTIVKHQAQHSS